MLLTEEQINKHVVFSKDNPASAELTDELMQEWITKLELQPLVDKTKSK
jgi:hypothetical protein